MSELRTQKKEWVKLFDSEGNEIWINPNPVYNEEEGAKRLTGLNIEGFKPQKKVSKSRSMEKLTNYLKDSKKRMTQEREALLTILFKMNKGERGEFSAKEVLEEFEKVNFKISKPSVFMNMGLFLEIGILNHDTRSKFSYVLN